MISCVFQNSLVFPTDLFFYFRLSVIGLCTDNFINKRNNMNISNLKLIYFHSTEIKKDDIIWGLIELGIDVINPEYNVKLHIYDEIEIENIISFLTDADGVITQNFSAAVAEACHRKQIPYISWVYDSPQRALYMKEAKYDSNYIFVFDRMQIRRLEAIGVKNLFYCPLASNITKTSAICITDEDEKLYGCEVAFVGQLYNKPYHRSMFIEMSNTNRNFYQNALKRYTFSWDGKSIFPVFNTNLFQYFEKLMSKSDLEYYEIDRQYLSELLFFMPYLSSQERAGVLKQLSENYFVELYTNDYDDSLGLNRVNIHPPVKETEMYKIFYSSRINLNITMRGIESGVPQRVFDIMSVGGFVLSNYQPEIEEMFQVGKELEVFHSLEELQDKTDYYLRHENERIRIAVAGYQRVKQDYSYPKLLHYILGKVYR